MPRRVLFVLLGVFALILVFGYSALLDTSTDPRPVPTDTPAPDPGGGGGEEVAAGAAIYQAQCASCHTIDGASSIGPTWQGLAGSEVPLEDGSTVTADEAYIRESIEQPAAKIHDGYQPIMPAFEFTDEEIASLVAFIESLE